MEKLSKKFWIIILAIPITIIGLFVAYLIVTYSQTYTASNSTSGSSVEDAVSSDYQGGVYMDEAIDITSTGTGQDVIKTGYVSMSADDMDTTLTTIQTLKEEYGAQVTSLTDSGEDNDRLIYITLKVEESDFDALYNAIKALPGEFTYSSIGSTDVTETVEDLEIQLASLEALETRLNDIMDQADTVTDILAVQAQLTTTQTEIESIKAQLKSYDSQTSYSYITVYMSQTAVGSSISGDEWRPLGIIKEAAQALWGFVKFLGTGLIWILVFSPVVAAIVIPVVIIQKKAKK